MPSRSVVAGRGAVSGDDAVAERAAPTATIVSAAIQTASHHFEVGVQGACRLDGLKNGDDIARSHAQGVQALNEVVQGGRAVENGKAAHPLLDADRRAKNLRRLPLPDRGPLDHLRRSGVPNRSPPWGEGHTANVPT